MISLLYTQVHCLRDDKVLLMRRHKEPNLGLWVAPGGKIEEHESPYECAVRELYEETGLAVGEMHLRGIVSTVAPTIAQSYIHFLYAVTDFTGELVADDREGALCWWPVTETGQLPMPHANALFLPHVVDVALPFYQAKYVYTADWNIVQVIDLRSGLTLSRRAPQCLRHSHPRLPCAPAAPVVSCAWQSGTSSPKEASS